MGPIAGSDILDLAFLDRQTFGDRELQRELLALFDEQCAELAPVLLNSASSEARLHAAHRLKGCAAAIGAGRIVDAAGALEQALERLEGAGVHSPEVGLEQAIGQTRAAMRIWRLSLSDDLAKGGEVA